MNKSRFILKSEESFISINQSPTNNSSDLRMNRLLFIFFILILLKPFADLWRMSPKYWAWKTDKKIEQLKHEKDEKKYDPQVILFSKFLLPTYTSLIYYKFDCLLQVELSQNIGCTDGIKAKLINQKINLFSGCSPYPTSSYQILFAARSHGVEFRGQITSVESLIFILIHTEIFGCFLFDCLGFWFGIHSPYQQCLDDYIFKREDNKNNY